MLRHPRLRALIDLSKEGKIPRILEVRCWMAGYGHWCAKPSVLFGDFPLLGELHNKMSTALRASLGQSRQQVTVRYVDRNGKRRCCGGTIHSSRKDLVFSSTFEIDTYLQPGPDLRRTQQYTSDFCKKILRLQLEAKGNWRCLIRQDPTRASTFPAGPPPLPTDVWEDARLDEVVRFINRRLGTSQMTVAGPALLGQRRSRRKCRAVTRKRVAVTISLRYGACAGQKLCLMIVVLIGGVTSQVLRLFQGACCDQHCSRVLYSLCDALPQPGCLGSTSGSSSAAVGGHDASADA